MNIYTFNPSEFKRTQWVKYGQPRQLDDQFTFPELGFLPFGGVQAALVEVSPHSNGKAKVISDSTEINNIMGPFFSKAMERMGVPRMKLSIDGKDYDFTFTVQISRNQYMSIWEWTCVTPHGYGKLWTYFGHGCEHLDIELCFYPYKPDLSQSIYMPLNLTFKVENGLPRIYGREEYHNIQEVNLIDTLAIADASGIRFDGAILPLPADDIRDMDTLMSAHSFPLLAAELDPWAASWGLWERTATGSHSPVSDNPDPMAYRGYILQPRAGGTGEQEGFGMWKFLDVLQRRDMRLFYGQHYAVHQQIRRPIHYFEPSGMIFQAKKHPKWVSWDERTHYHFGVSSDRAYRLGWNNPVEGDWTGEDDQHYSGIAISQHVMLTGSMASKFECEFKAQHAHGKAYWPTEGRALGRFIPGIISIAQVAWSGSELLERLSSWSQDTIDVWNDTNSTRTEPANHAFGLRLFTNDGNTQIRPVESILWEDAISINGLMVGAKFLRPTEPGTANTLEQMAYYLVSSLLYHGLNPLDHRRIGKAVKWDGKGTVYVEYWNSKVFASANNTAYHEWGLPAWHLAKELAQVFNDTSLNLAADIALQSIDKRYFNLSSYSGVI